MSAAAFSLLHVATVPAPLTNFFLPYAAHFRSLGWLVEAAANGATGVPSIVAAFDATHDLPLGRSMLDPANLAAGLPAIRDLVQERGPDIVHVHTPIASFVTRLAIRTIPRRRRPVVIYTAHGFHFHEGAGRVTNTLFRTAERVAGRWTDRLVVINDEDEQAARKAGIVAGGRLVRMPGVGIDTHYFSRHSVAAADVVAVRSELGIPAGAPLFAAVAELHPNKQHAVMISALAQMRRQDAHLVIAGDGRERHRLTALAAEFRVAERTHFVGHVVDVRPLIVAADALVLASRREGLARAIMEALALETPVIASEARGNRELVGGDAGYLFPTGDAGALAALMDRRLTHRDEGEQMAMRARARTVSRYELTRLVERHEQLYSEALAERQ